MKVFITGGAGFIGSTLSERLLKLGHDVTIFDNFSSPSLEIGAQKAVSIVQGDVLDLSALKSALFGHDLVCHFAANPDIARGSKDTELDLRLSTMATQRVLEAMKEMGVRKLLFPSGSGVYGDTDGQLVDEDFGPLLPVSLYGAGKLAAEALISAFCHMFGMTAWVFRPANVVGGRQTHGVALDFINKLKKDPKHLQILGDGKQCKSYLHVEDLLDAMLLALGRDDDRISIYNVASDDQIDVDQIARLVIEAMKLKDVKLSYTGGKTGWPGDVPVVRLNTTKVKSLGWSASLSSKQAMQKSIEEMLLRHSINHPA